MRQPTFLWKNERGIYFFRARIPKQFSAHFSSSEIKRSLKTDSYRLAVKLARLYRTGMDKEIEILKQGLHTAEEKNQHKAYWLEQFQENTKRIEAQARQETLSHRETTQGPVCYFHRRSSNHNHGAPRTHYPIKIPLPRKKA